MIPLHQRLTHSLGSGSFVSAYHVTKGNSDYCLNVSHSVQQFPDLQNIHELLENDFQILYQFNHPNITKCYGSYWKGDRFNIVMELQTN
jgi:serine/threonine protein kinase